MLSMFVLAAGLGSVSLPAISPEQLGEICYHLAVVVALGVGVGTHLILSRKHPWGGILLATGLIATFVPAALVMLSTRGAPLSYRDRKPLILETREGQRIARHPHLQLSFPVPEPLDVDEDIECQVMDAYPSDCRVYAFSGDGKAVICVLSSPLRDLLNDPQSFVDGAIEPIDVFCLLGPVEQSGNGVRTDVRYAFKEQGVTAHCRIYITPGEEKRTHAISVLALGFDMADADYILNGCGGVWPY